jgi:hypothetical protein
MLICLCKMDSREKEMGWILGRRGHLEAFWALSNGWSWAALGFVRVHMDFLEVNRFAAS